MNNKQNSAIKFRLTSAGCFTFEEGGALIELALTLPLLFIMLLGAAEFARVAYGAIEVTNAARAGVAYGSQSPEAAADSPSITTSSQSDSANINSLSVPTATQVCYCSDGALISDCSAAAASCTSPKRIKHYVQVNTQYTMDPLIHVPGLPTSYTLHGQALMRVAEP